MRTAALAIACVTLASCTGGMAPPDQQLADQCQILTDAYTNATAAARQHKLSEAQIHVMVSLEPVSAAYCNPDAPPTDTRTALQNIHDAVGQLQLMGATQ